MTAPCENTNTVFVVSEKGSRFSLPSTVRAPFTVTDTSSATGCGLLGAASGRVDVPRGFAVTVPGVAAITPDSLTIGGMRRSLTKQNFRSGPIRSEEPPSFHYMFYFVRTRQP